MFRAVITGAWRLDQWLKDKVGRPYTILLSAALIAGISANARALAQEVRTTGSLIVIVFTVALDLVLLVNQLAQLHEYREARRARRAARRKQD